MAGREAGWNLESFIDSMIVELDNAQNTLSVRGLTRPLTYTVRDVDLDLQVFPEFDGRSIRFRNAKPGERGASKISLQLGSITDRQIRETTRGPITRDDVSLDVLEDLDDDTRTSLKAIGVSSVSDLERIEKRNVDIPMAARKKIDYGALAQVIQKARRQQVPPRIDRASLTATPTGRMLTLTGSNLALQSEAPFPIARVNRRSVPVLEATATRVALDLGDAPLEPVNRMHLALDRHSILTLRINS